MRCPRSDQLSHQSDRGSATAETAVVLPVVVVAVAVVLAAAGVGNAQLRCQDAARAGARVLARGEGAPAAHSTVLAAAPAGARSTLTGARDGPAQVHVEVSVTPLGGGPSGAWRVGLACSATAWPESTGAA